MPDFKRRTKIALVLLGVMLSLTTVAIGAVINGKTAGQGVEFDQQGGPTVVAGSSVNFSTQNPWQNSNEIVLQPYGTFRSQTNTRVRVTTWNGTYTNVTNLAVSNSKLTININDKQRVAVRGNTETLKYKNMTVDDGKLDFAYAGPNGGTTYLTIYELPANETIAAVDITGTTLATATTDSNGVATFSLPQSSHTVGLETNLNTTAPYYENETGNVTSGGWIEDDNASVDNIGDSLWRIPRVVIGTGGQDTSGTGYVGLLLLALIMVGTVVGATMRAGVGPVGGSILSLVVGYGLTDLGLAPSWVKPILLFGLGIILVVAYLRVVR